MTQPNPSHPERQPNRQPPSLPHELDAADDYASVERIYTPIATGDAPLLPTDPASYYAPTRSARNGGGCRGCLWVIGGAVGCLGLALVVLLASVAFGVTSFSALLGGIGTALGVNQPSTAAVISTQTIVTGIQPLGQLVSVSTQLAKADVSVGIGQGALNACGFSANHVVQGAVEAGIDLTQIDETDIAFDPLTNRYTVTIPAPALTSCRIDYIRQYERSFTTCNVDWDEARLIANYTSLIDFRETAIEGGILSRAENEARVILSNFIRVLTGREVDIVFEAATSTSEAGSVSYPPSCAPDVPQGWIQQTNGQWIQVP